MLHKFTISIHSFPPSTAAVPRFPFWASPDGAAAGSAPGSRCGGHRRRAASPGHHITIINHHLYHDYNWKKTMND